MKATRIARLYGPTKPNAESLLKGIVTAWSESTTAGAIRLRLKGSAVYLGDSVLTVASPRDAFPTGLNDLGVAALVLRPGLDRPGANAILEAFTNCRDASMPAQALRELNLECLDVEWEGVESSASESCLDVTKYADEALDLAFEQSGRHIDAPPTVSVPPIEEFLPTPKERGELRGLVQGCDEEATLRHGCGTVCALAETSETDARLLDAFDGILCYVLDEGSIELGIRVFNEVSGIPALSAHLAESLNSPECLHAYLARVEAEPNPDLLAFAALLDRIATHAVEGIAGWLGRTRYPAVVSAVLLARGKVTVAAIRDVLPDSDVETRRRIVTLLLRLSKSETLRVVSAEFHRLDVHQRREVVRLAGASQDRRTRREMVQALCDDAPEVRAATLDALQPCDDRAFAEMLERLLESQAYERCSVREVARLFDCAVAIGDQAVARLFGRRLLQVGLRSRLFGLRPIEARCAVALGRMGHKAQPVVSRLREVACWAVIAVLDDPTS